jgi:hypothetical protein
VEKGRGMGGSAEEKEGVADRRRLRLVLPLAPLAPCTPRKREH